MAAHQGSKNHSYSRTNYFLLSLSLTHTLSLSLSPASCSPAYFALIAVSVVMSLSSSKRLKKKQEKSKNSTNKFRCIVLGARHARIANIFSMNFYAGSSVQKEKETEGESGSGSGNETDSVQVCFTYLDFVQLFFCEVFLRFHLP